MGDLKDPDQPQGEKPTSDDPQTDPKGGETPPWGDQFDPARAWATIQNLRKTEGEYTKLRKQVDDAEAERKRAEEAALAEQQKFQELADKRQSEIDELRPKAESAERFKTALQKYLDAEREGLPTHIITLLDRMDVDEQLAYIAENRDTLKPEQEEQRQGVPPTRTGKKQSPTTRDDIRDKYLKDAGVQV